MCVHGEVEGEFVQGLQRGGGDAGQEEGLVVGGCEEGCWGGVEGVYAE